MSGEETDLWLTYSESSGSNSSEEEADFTVVMYCLPAENILIPVLFFLIAFVGLVGNALVIYIIVVLKEYKKTVTNVYVVQLAIADFLFLFVLPFEGRTRAIGQWTYGDAWCKITEAIRMLNYYSSILFLTLMSVDRYLAINHAMNTKMTKFRSKNAVRIISCLIWLLSLCAVLYIFIQAKVDECLCVVQFGDLNPQSIDGGNDSYYDYHYENYDDHVIVLNESAANTSFSYLDSEYSEKKVAEAYANIPGWCSYKEYYGLNLWIILNFLLAFILPLVVIIACYAQILCKISQPLAIGTKSNRSNKTRKRVTMMVTALVSVFIVCWLPYHSFNLARVNDSQLTQKTCLAVQNFTLVFAYLSSALNPFLYTFLGTNFRKRWKSALGRTRSFRPSIGSRSGADYQQGRKSRRRKSSGVSLTGNGKSPDDFSQSNYTKHTVVPSNNATKIDDHRL